MHQEFVIADNTVKYANGRNPLNERLLYGGTEGQWSRNFDLAKRYSTAAEVIGVAKELQRDVPVKVFVMEYDGNGVRLAEVVF